LNRGLAILDDSLFMGTVDGRLIAVDAKTGRERWNVAVAGARPEAGYSLTLAPLVVKDKIIAGPAGGEFGIRGFIAAFDPATGNELWRFYTIPGPGEKGHETWTGDSWRQGGGSIWTTGTYDPELNLTYWGTGNPGPVFTGEGRSGDNLYSNSVLALDPDTGTLKWHFQFTPHDEFDYDATQVPVLAEIEHNGQTRKVVLFANRNGFFYVLDRTNGEFLFARPFSKVTWTSGLDAKGRPQNMVRPTAQGTVVYPHLAGATNWYSPSFNPKTGLLYVASWMESSAIFSRGPAEYVEGRAFLGTFPTWERFQRRKGWGSTARR
jgi:alcohol dehydrogenase (cytochrome c)